LNSLDLRHVLAPDIPILLNFRRQIGACLRQLMTLAEVADRAVKSKCQQETDRNSSDLDEKVFPTMRYWVDGLNVRHLG
jgi:hypothetical protein